MRRRPRLPRSTTVGAIAFALLLLTALPSARASPPASAPLALDRDLLSNLTAPSVNPGASSSVSYSVADPAWFGSLSSVVLVFQVYAWNHYPGGSPGGVPSGAAPLLLANGRSALVANITIGSVASGTATHGSVGFVTSAGTPTGTYAIRAKLTFTENASGYVFESRGWFSESAWQNATTAPNGSGMVNASRLGVSGILPETAVYVAPSDWAWAIGALVAGGLVLVGAGAWLYFRRGSKSSSGAANGEAPGAMNAPSAFGNSRSNPGDSRKS